MFFLRVDWVYGVFVGLIGVKEVLNFVENGLLFVDWVFYYFGMNNLLILDELVM